MMPARDLPIASAAVARRGTVTRARGYGEQPSNFTGHEFEKE
jgi:hypothetical protein